MDYNGPKSSTIDRLYGDFTQWHVLGLEWSPQGVVWTYDGMAWSSVTDPTKVPSAPLALGMQTAAGPCGSPPDTFHPCPDSRTPSVSVYEIDWVRQYTYNSAGTPLLPALPVYKGATLNNKAPKPKHGGTPNPPSGGGGGGGGGGGHTAPVRVIKLTPSVWAGHHTVIRKKHRLSPMSWSKSLAAVALTQVKACSPVSSAKVNVKAFKSMRPRLDISSWTNEASSWSCATNKCSRGKTCSHYLKIMNAANAKVGCAAAICHSNSPFGSANPNWTLLVCEYGKALKAGVRPFAASKC